MVTRSLLCAALLALAGCVCQTPTYVRPTSTGDPWNTTSLIDADPASVSTADLTSHVQVVNQRYWAHSQVNGIIWPALRTDTALPDPDRWVTGGDSGIFTGTALAAFAFQYKAEPSTEGLQHAFDTLRGLYILTHSTGTPGVIQRNAFPADQPDKFGYPAEWASRIAAGFVHTGPAFDDPFGGPQIPPQTYYTRGTKDQLTGMVLGLAAAWTVFDPATVFPAHIPTATSMRDVVKQITQDIAVHLYAYDWYIRDEYGHNDTNADHVSGLLKAALLALVVKTGVAPAQEDYDKEFSNFMLTVPALIISDRFSNFQQYYAHNLRVSRAISIWLLEGPGSPKGQQVASYIGTNVWDFTKGHKNAWFAFAQGITTPSDAAAVAEGLYALKSLSLKPLRGWSSPYHGQAHKPDLGAVASGCTSLFALDPHLRKPVAYTTWQKEPWDVGDEPDWDKQGLLETSGLDFLLAYWMGKAYGLF